MFRKFGVFALVLTLVLTAGVLPGRDGIQAQENDRIIIGTLDLPANLDPAMADNFMSWEILGHIYTGLTRQVPGTNTYELAAAADHTIEDNGLTHRFTIKPDLAFTDGTPIDANTFANSINRVLELDRGGADIMREFVASVEATDSQELVFALYHPVDYFDALLALAPFFAVHPDDFPPDDVNRQPESLTGNGVYMLEDWSPGDFVALRANPEYQLGESARTAEIHLQSYEHTEALRLALESGEVDMAWRDVLLPDAITTVEDNPEILMKNVPSSRMWYLYMSKSPKFEDISIDLVREVLANLIDRRLMVDEYFDGYLSPAFSLVPETVESGYIALWDTTPDPQGVVERLREAGYRPNRNMLNVFLVSSRTTYGDFAAGAISNFPRAYLPLRTIVNIGLSAAADSGVFADALQAGDYQMAMFAWTPVAMHPDAYLYPLLHSEGILADGGEFGSPELDQVLEDARTTDDPAEKDALYQQAQEIIYDTYTVLPLWQDINTVLYHEYISGVTIEANFYLHYNLLERE
ncbi:MAG: hypothetical protein GYB66_13585 [Chloroflexi bacterium]|nr:hypothetical protein [Chloroflexota bacterium]